MEATVKMGSSLPVKAAVSQRQAPGKASGSKGDFTKLLQEKKDLAQNPEEEKAITPRRTGWINRKKRTRGLKRRKKGQTFRKRPARRLYSRRH